MSQLNQILERIAAKQKQITIQNPAGVNYVGPKTIVEAFPYPTADPSIAHAPFFYNQFKGSSKVAVQAVTGMYEITSEIEMVLCFTTVVAETNIANIYLGTSLWRDAVLAMFAANVRLGNDMSFVLDCRITQISAFETISTEGGTVWGSMTFTLVVRELYPVTITA